MFKTQKLVSSYKDFQILSKLGEGAYSTVFKARRELDNQIYALKKVKMDALTEKERENALNEVRILASITDPFIIAYKEAFFDEESNNLCIIMEYAEHGDLQKRIKECVASKKYLPEKEIWKCVVHISKALQTLHSLEILHRDLKSANVFITSDGFLKLGDLNVSKQASQGLVYTQTGTPYYASPEVWRDEPYGIKSDIWSLGCLLYELAALKPPFQANDMSQLFKKVQKGTIERIPNCYSNELFGIIEQCLKVNPDNRPFALQTLKNPAVNMHIEEMEGYELVKRDSKVNLINKIEVPKNLAFLKEKLPKPNYERNWYADTESEEIVFQKEENNKKLRVSSADSRRSDVIEKSNLMNHLKNQNINLGANGNLYSHLPLSSRIKNNEQSGNLIQNIIMKNSNNALNNNINIYSNNYPIISKSPIMQQNGASPVVGKSPIMMQQSRLIKSPSVGISNDNFKLPSINKIPPNNSLLPDKKSSLIMMPKNPNIGIFNLNKPIEFSVKSPLAVRKTSSHGTNPIVDGLYQNKNSPSIGIIQRQKLGLMRPNSQGVPQSIYNNNNIISERSPPVKIINNDNMMSHKPYGVVNGSPAYKVVLKSRPLSHNSQRTDIFQESIPKKEERKMIEPQISEEKDIGKITNKLRPFSCNSNTKKFDQPIVLQPHIMNNPSKKTDLFSGLVLNHNMNLQKGTLLEELSQNTPKTVFNNRALLYNQKPVTAPNIGRDAIKILPNSNSNNLNINLNSNNNLHTNLKNLYSKQALEMFEKNNVQKSHFSGGNIGGRPVINNGNNANYNLLPNQYYNK